MNNFPRLLLRECEPVLVGLSTFGDAVAFDAFVQGGAWDRDMQPGLSPWLLRPVEHHRLVPCARWTASG